MTDRQRGERSDGKCRCVWAQASAEYREYHDTEWGQPLHGSDALFERLCLEAFQSGLSWITILRKREAFRLAFDGFEIDRVARFTQQDIERLLTDDRIVRNRQKIEACVHNAKLVRDDNLDLDTLLWGFAPQAAKARPRSIADVPATSTESVAMAKDLKKRGFKFIGPTTAYALMQAVGMVDDHVADCFILRPD